MSNGDPTTDLNIESPLLQPKTNGDSLTGLDIKSSPSPPKKTFLKKAKIPLILGALVLFIIGLYFFLNHVLKKSPQKNCEDKNSTQTSIKYRWCKDKCHNGNCTSPHTWEDTTCDCTGCDTNKGVRCGGKCIAKCPSNSTMNMDKCNCECSSGYKDMGGGVCEPISTCKKDVTNGASVDTTDGSVTATFYTDHDNSCQTGCNAAGVGAATQEQCNKICSEKGYAKFHGGKCVKALTCASTQVEDFVAANPAACQANPLCDANKDNLAKLDIGMVNNDTDWTCGFPASKVWQTACSNAQPTRGTWVNNKYCFLPKKGCLTHTVINTDDAIIHLLAYLGNEALQNHISVEHDVTWVVTLRSNSQTYTYRNAVISAAGPQAVCPKACKDCTPTALSLNVLSEGNTPTLPGAYTIGLTASFTGTGTNITLGENDGSVAGSVNIAASSGSFPGPTLNLDKAKTAVTNLDKFEGMLEHSLRDVVKKNLVKSGVPYEKVGDAVVTPCTSAFCKGTGSIARKMVVFAWDPIATPITFSGKVCSGMNGTDHDIRYWVGKVNTAHTPHTTDFVADTKDLDKLYLMDTATPGTTATYYMQAYLWPKNQQAPDTTNGLGSIPCHSRRTSLTVPVTEYSNANCRQFLPEQVVGDIWTTQTPVPNYAYPENGRCVWGSGPNVQAWQDYACLFNDKEKGNTPTPPSLGSFELYDGHTCNTVQPMSGGTTGTFTNSRCDANKTSCTTGASTEQVTTTCPNTLGFQGRTTTPIDETAFKDRMQSAIMGHPDTPLTAWPRTSGDAPDFKKVFYDMVKSKCHPMSDPACTAKDGSLQNCSSTWATTPTTCADDGSDKDTACKDALSKAGVRDCSKNPTPATCVTNVVEPWQCSGSGAVWTCTQTRSSCFPYTTNIDESKPDSMCCNSHGYAVKDKNGGFRCASDAAGNGTCIEKDNLTWTGWDCKTPKNMAPSPPPPPAKPVCDEILSTYNSSTKKCEPKFSGACDGNSTSCQGEKCVKNCDYKNLTDKDATFSNCVENCNVKDSFETCDKRRWSELPKCTKDCITAFPCDSMCSYSKHSNRGVGAYISKTPWTSVEDCAQYAIDKNGSYFQHADTNCYVYGTGDHSNCDENCWILGVRGNAGKPRAQSGFGSGPDTCNSATQATPKPKPTPTPTPTPGTATPPTDHPECKFTQTAPSRADQVARKWPTCWSKQEGFISNPGCSGSDLDYCGQYPHKGQGFWSTCKNPLPDLMGDDSCVDGINGMRGLGGLDGLDGLGR